MSLRDWLANGWLNEQKTNRQEIVDMLSAVERDLADCSSSGLSPDWRLTIAYTAAMEYILIRVRKISHVNHQSNILPSLQNLLSMLI